MEAMRGAGSGGSDPVGSKQSALDPGFHVRAGTSGALPGPSAPATCTSSIPAAPQQPLAPPPAPTA